MDELTRTAGVPAQAGPPGRSHEPLQDSWQDGPREGSQEGPQVGRAYWADQLARGGATLLPRWAPGPAGDGSLGGTGTGLVEAELPGAVTDAAYRLAGAWGVPLRALLLAAHARVLATLSAETEVISGYARPDVRTGARTPRPLRLDVSPGSWRDLVRRAARAEAALLAAWEVPVDALRDELAVPGPVSEAVVAPDGDPWPLPDGAVLGLGTARSGRRLHLLLRHRRDALDAGAAARLLGYHVSALGQLVTEPEADHGSRTLLSPAERRYQLERLGGPRRERPDVRVPGLVAAQARRRPDAVAVVHRGDRLTYRELDGRADRLAHALLARALPPEGVVAVVTERDLAWAAAVLGVMRAGGAYLPLEPRFPAERIRTALRRAGCRLVLTTPGCRAALDAAVADLPGVTVVEVGAALTEPAPPGPPEVRIGPDHLAYLFFTSGSTGEPKGAMCEHAGMLNHVLAKVEDLGVDEATVVAQTATQCFDISLWQLVAALVVGGRTLLVEQDAVLDVPRLLDTVDDGQVSVLQVVPSYLEAVLSHLERHPRPLPHLRVVSVTGEAVKAELVQRWFATVPGVRLVNAYGLTETCDDTNHEVMDAPPADGRVPLGRCIANVDVDVVDEHLEPVPLGAPGEIVFSGVCVGRGYVNDPERTAQAFIADPHRPGRRLYRSGDHGRWRPDGKLEFLGRRDAQVKVSGFRIELGEVEDALLRVPGVRDGAVVVAERDGQGRHLVAFCTGRESLTPDEVRAALGRTLPAYMVPRAVHRRADLPLTGNGKVDRRALAALAAATAAEEERDPPRTAEERRVAAAWAEVLGVPEARVDRRHHFFDQGGTSLAAVKLVVRLDRAVRLADVMRAPRLADLAALLGAAPPGAAIPRQTPPDQT
jgi:amino acid adenylation domain-containing protein